MRGELPYLDGVHGGAGLAHSPDVFLGHLSDPQHAVLLQAGVGEVDRALAEGLIQVAAPDENQTADVSGKFQEDLPELSSRWLRRIP